MLVSYYDMDFIRDYECDSSSSEGREYADLDNSCKPANPKDKIDVWSVRKLYLITYSQKDVGRFPPRQSFVEAVFCGLSAWKNIQSPVEVTFKWP